MDIQVIDLTKIIKGTPVLNEVSVEFRSGEVAGLSGINGSGKTMLMRVLMGFVKPTSGSVTVDGELLGRKISFPESAGFLIENPAFLPSYSGLANLSMIASIKRTADQAAQRLALERVGLDPDDKKKYRKYSLGMKQRLGIAAAIMESPDLILLDEPTNALDVEGIALLEEVVRAERERGALIIVSCHDPQLLRSLSDVIYHMTAGRISDSERVKRDSHA